LGSKPLPCDQWLLRTTDIAGFLLKIGPALERRVAQSDCALSPAQLCTNLYREAFLLRFDQGTVAEVQALGFVDASKGLMEAIYASPTMPLFGLSLVIAGWMNCAMPGRTS
jgi:hypothetical protein